MRNSFLTVMAAQLSLALFYMPGAHSSPCPAGTTFLNVATTTELEDMMTSMNCTGEGVFNVTWVGSVPLVETIEVSNQKSLTVSGSSSTGVVSNRPRSDAIDVWGDVIDAGGATGMFRVSDGSTLSLNNLVLEGGISATGAAIEVRSSSSVYVDGCVFRSNIATTGGAIYADSSEIHIIGDTAFTDNSAEDNGGAIFVEHSELRVDGTISFANNSAGNDGGEKGHTMYDISVVTYLCDCLHVWYTVNLRGSLLAGPYSGWDGSFLCDVGKPVGDQIKPKPFRDHLNGRWDFYRPCWFSQETNPIGVYDRNIRR